MAVLNDIPGAKEALAQAREEEESRRELAFTDLPETICGLDVKQLTPNHLRLLFAAKTPFLCGGHRTPEAIAQFLWIVSEEFSNSDLDRTAFIQLIADMPVDWETGIDDYLDRVFMDSPTASGSRKAPIVSLSASLVHELASAYGWTPEQTLNQPLARLYQLFRLITRDNNPKATFTNKISDVVTKKLLLGDSQNG